MADVALVDTASPQDIAAAHNRAYYRNHANKEYGENVTWRWVGSGGTYLLDLDNDLGLHLNVGGVFTVTDSGVVVAVPLTTGAINAGAITATALTVTPGATSLTTLSTSGLATLNSASVTTTLGVAGTSTLGVVNAGATAVTTLSTSGLATLQSASVTTTLAVTGTSTFGVVNAGATAVTTLSSSGLATLNSVSVTTTLSVTGTSTLGVLNAGATATTTLSSSGLATLNSVSVTTTLSVTSTSTFTGAVTMVSNLTVGNATGVTTGVIRIPNGQSIYSEETGGTDRALIGIDGSNVLRVGATAGIATTTIESASNTYVASGTTVHLYAGADVFVVTSAPAIGFFGSAPNTKQTITGAKAGNVALTNLLSALANYGLITDNTT